MWAIDGLQISSQETGIVAQELSWCINLATEAVVAKEDRQNDGANRAVDIVERGQMPFVDGFGEDELLI